MLKVEKLRSNVIENLTYTDSPSFSGIIAGECGGDILGDAAYGCTKNGHSYYDREKTIMFTIMKKEIHTNDRIKRNNLGKFLANNKS